MKIFYRILLFCGVVFASSGCSVNNQRVGASKYWGNHKCTAVSQSNQSYQGWSTAQSSAEDSAIAKCEEANGTGTCHITGCG